MVLRWFCFVVWFACYGLTNLWLRALMFVFVFCLVGCVCMLIVFAGLLDWSCGFGFGLQLVVCWL